MGILSSLENAAESAAEMVGLKKKEDETPENTDTAAGTDSWVGAPTGQTETEPTPVTPEPTPASTTQTYTVQSGDTLSKISEHFYGHAHDYMKIYNANRDKLNDPDDIEVGQELTIPE